jgi:UDP-N-acetylglucosamine transferase subunit ALG13
MKTLKLLLVAMLVLGGTGVVLCQDAPARPRMGTLVKVDGKNMVVKVGRGDTAKEETIATDEKTTFVVDAESGKLADLKADMRVVITPATGTAEKVNATSKGLNGAIVKVDGKNVIVKTGRGDTAKEVTVATDEKTKVFVDDKAAKLEDLKADMRVTVLPETGTATKVIARAAMERPRN